MSSSTPHLDSVTRTFDAWARDGRGEGMESGHRDVVLQMLDRAAILAHHHVVDLGCGVGWTVRILAGLVRAGRAYGIDASEEMIRRARTVPHPPNASFTAAPVSRLPLADASIHRALSMESIYYWSDIPAALREVHRVLAPGGRFLAAMEFYAENPFTAGWPEALGIELRRHSAAEYEQMLRVAGFESVSSERLGDRRPPPRRADFRPSEYFPDYEAYLKYREAGALLVAGAKAGAEIPPAAAPRTATGAPRDGASPDEFAV